MSSASSRAPSPARQDGAGVPPAAVVVVTPELCSKSTYSDMATKTVENIRKLQENVSGGLGNEKTTIWVGNYQVPAIPSGSEGNEVEGVSRGADDNIIQEQISSGGNSASARSTTSSAAFPSPSSPRPSIPSISDALAGKFNALVTIDPNWQSTKKSVRERNAVMCNNALMADVYFNVGADIGEDVTQIPAHKYVLSTSSTVFYAMFFGGLAEPRDVIDVPDVEPEAFLAMLRYMYADDISLDSDNVLATLYCSKRYIVPHLAQECIRFLEATLSARNACVLLSQARLFEEPELMQRSWEVIDAQAERALSSESFTDIDFNTLKAILERESLNCKETVVFKAAMNWAKAECIRRNGKNLGITDPVAMRDVLGEALSLIRFPAMGVEDFADEVAKSGLLTLQQTTDMFMYFTARLKPRLLYPVEPRKGLHIQNVHRFQSCAYRSNQWRYRGRCDSIQFSVDRRVFIMGFGLYGSSNGSSNYTAQIELKQSFGPVLATSLCNFSSDGSSNTFHVFFDIPVQVEPDQHFTASVTLDGAELSYFGQEGMAEVVSGCVTFQFQCAVESTNGTGVQGGQIPELLFYGPTHVNGDNSGTPSSTLKRTQSRKNKTILSHHQSATLQQSNDQSGNGEQ